MLNAARLQPLARTPDLADADAATPGAEGAAPAGRRSEATRTEIITQYYPLVRKIAARLARRLPSSVDQDELVHEGVLGLIDALDRFDESKSVPFKAYAEIRIKGAMVDSLRHDDWVPRSVRRKSNRNDRARTDLAHSLGRAPTRDELIAELDVTVDQYEALEKDSRIHRLLSLDASTTEDGSTPLIECIAGELGTAEDTLGAKQVRQHVSQAVHNLPAKERLAVTNYYMQHMTLREIGGMLGVTESRACQLRTQGISRLRFRLRETLG